ncbi:alpha/beta fold hydrolase [Polluticaenibacter yanchengensis]|uniref:Alpha/beta hydrolase n=1 Tax=Polluticaenibacter yanchengensis TaxID=3014562 RepID=A0ABT4UG86_9BACT|nr:alpha/beta hydrolase [Chitinophagaceae bacterium LY-5]
MTRIILLFISFLFTLLTTAQNNTLYSKSYGKSSNPPVIFIHGGPSGNATLFEATTAEKLATKGFFVIVYDRRGEGRSADSTATFTYDEAIRDLAGILNHYKIEKTSLIAHSFGGLVATLFTEKYPGKVNALILAGALFSQQETYDHIIKTTRQIYKVKNDSSMLSKVEKIALLDPHSAAYRKQCFELAGQNNFFKMPFPTNDANKLHEIYEKSDFYKQNIRNQKAPLIFYKNEPKNNIDTKPVLKAIKKMDVKLFAIYGQQDNIFSHKQLNDMKTIVKKPNFKIIDNCSHYLFVDQQEQFIETITKWLK